MALDPDAPRPQYAKRDYHIRLVGRVPRHQPLPPDWTFDGDHHPMYKLQGIALCSIDVTMSHVAVMYAAGRLLDSIREPFNASVIRAEMDALRSRDEASVPPEDYERWKEETGAMKDIDPLVNETAHDPGGARNTTPRCPYLCQLLFKSFGLGNQPVFWFGAREPDPRRDVPRNMKGRSGYDYFYSNDAQTWYLYIDVSHPLQPRYAFIEELDIIKCTGADRERTRPKPLRIFNAREHAYRFMIPESERFAEAEKFGEEPWAPHRSLQPDGRRRSIELTENLKSNPEYMALLESRVKRAKEHPAVVRMQEFGWLGVEDVIKPDGSALLQDVWKSSLKIYGQEFHTYVVKTLVQRPEKIVVVRSEALEEIDRPAPLEWEYSLIGSQGSLAKDLSLKLISTRALCIRSIPRRQTGGLLSLLDQRAGAIELITLKTVLARVLWNRSSELGTGFYDAAYKWLRASDPTKDTGDEFSDVCEPWLVHDYDVPDPSISAPDTDDEDMWWILLYQGLCYRDSVAVERQRQIIPEELDSDSGSQTTNSSNTFNIAPEGLYSYGEFPGRALGDAAHPAFDASHFPRMREHQILRALQIWSEQIWMPDLKSKDWDFDCGTPIPLRTLNVSGCHFVTRNTIRRALQIVPTITRIIMIGCASFSEVDLMLLSLDGTLNNVDCILTSASVREPFRDPSKKNIRRDSTYQEAQALLPRAPNEKIQARIDSVPGVFFDSTKQFKFSYSPNVLDLYFSNGQYSRSLSHTFARPPALSFNPETRQVVCGPPRFSVVLASHSITGAPVTGAALPRVPIDTGIEGIGTNGCGLTSVWRGIIDLIEFLSEPRMRNVQRWNAVDWSLVVKSCFSGPGKKWGQKSGLAGGGEFYGFPAYFKGGPGQANEEWIFAYQFRDVIAKIQTCWANGFHGFLYPESSAQDCWAFIRYGRDANPLSHEIPTIVLYNVREFRQEICPDIPILEDEAKWIARVEDLLSNGTWQRSYPILNWGIDRDMARQGDPTWEKLRAVAERLTKPKFMREIPHELMLLVERMMTCQLNVGTDPF